MPLAPRFVYMLSSSIYAPLSVLIYNPMYKLQYILIHHLKVTSSYILVTFPHKTVTLCPKSCPIMSEYVCNVNKFVSDMIDTHQSNRCVSIMSVIIDPDYPPFPTTLAPHCQELITGV
jgi:hypothetical protein